ncbi:hypothetical protein BCR44DRAFT_1195608 [Catenaria anguillulae PL171]|uniref:Uncharacterized protein n=1 Tax=Catenaria anguillulae PL171 TaxID=765915 RepID=A0A1Y2HGH9_9FUNG|nr:hypothetical protein BCR44DRAFT_1195608 [Catenaria anguillulae PL171]
MKPPSNGLVRPLPSSLPRDRFRPPSEVRPPRLSVRPPRSGRPTSSASQPAVTARRLFAFALGTGTVPRASRPPPGDACRVWPRPWRRQRLATGLAFGSRSSPASRRLQRSGTWEYGYGRDARYTDDRYSLRTDSRDWERDRGRDSHHQHHVDRYSRRPQEENHRDRDRQRHLEPLDHHRHTSEYQGSDRHDSGQSRRPAARGADSVANNPASPPPPPPPSLQSLATTTAQPNPMPSPALDTAPPSSGPPPLPSELHALAEQGPMLHQVEQAATKALSRQLPSSLMPDLLQDVDEILDLLLPVVLQSNQSGDVDQIVATLESRVKSQLKMARFTTKHLKTLREHPMLSGVLDPVIDSEVRRVAEGFKGE